MSRGLGKVERQILDVLSHLESGVEIRALTSILDGQIDCERLRQTYQKGTCDLLPDDWNYMEIRASDEWWVKERRVRRAVYRLKKAGRITVTSLHGSHEKRWGGLARVISVKLTPDKRDAQDERTTYTQDGSSPDLPDVSRAHPGFDASTYLMKSELLTRGWTDQMVMDFLRNKPDLLLGHWDAKNELYTRDRVVAVEASLAFQKRQHQLQQRRARRRKQK